MNIWTIVVIAVGLLAIAGIVVAEVSTAREPEQISCSGCGDQCTGDKNCDLTNCSAVNGGSCGCGK